MPLSFADAKKTKRYEDGAAWLELKTQLSANDVDVLEDLKALQRVPLAPLQGQSPAIEIVSQEARANRGCFDLLAVAWCVTGEKPTAADYDKLDEASRAWVIDCLKDAQTISRARVEGNDKSSSPQPETGPDSSAEAANPSGTRSPRTRKQ